MNFPCLVLTVGLSSAALTWALRCYALSRRLLDVPTPRSSHTVPTPRGGGMAIVVTSLLGLGALAATGHLPVATFWALLVGGGPIALIGFLDDHRSVPPFVRLATHLICSVVAVRLLGAPPHGGLAVGLAAAVGLAWMVNLYNFMDGIDGLAAMEAVVVCSAGAALCGLAALPLDTAGLPLVLAASGLGFLVWNFPRARIFMGDGGSGFLGFALGVCALRFGALVPRLFWGWAILLGVFVVDASFTLAWRALRRQRLTQAHRSHAYQHATAICGHHEPVTLAAAAITLLWLAPLAALVAAGRLDGPWGTLLAWLPLVAAAVRLDAGQDPAEPTVPVPAGPVPSLDIVPVTVIIPCFRCKDTIERALHSVQAQTSRPSAVILVDDCSGDGTLDLLRHLAGSHPTGWITAVALPVNRGPGSARNAGWTEARTEYVAFLDADETWHPRKLELQFQWMARRPDAALTGTGCETAAMGSPGLADPAPVPDELRFEPVPFSHLLWGNRFQTVSVMVRRDLPQRFTEGKYHSEDYLLWLQIARAGHGCFACPTPLSRVHKPLFGAGGLRSDLWAMQKGQVDTYLRMSRAGAVGRLHLAALLLWSFLRFGRRVALTLSPWR